MTEPFSRTTKGTAFPPTEERRRSQRVIIRIPVTLHMMVAGQTVTLQGATVEVNDHGAMVLCNRTLAAGTTLEMRNDRMGDKQPCRVTRKPVESNRGFLVPLEFLSPAPGFWQISFPPTDWKPQED